MQTPVLEHRENEAIDIVLHPPAVADGRWRRFMYWLKRPELLLLLDISPGQFFHLADSVEMNSALNPHAERCDLVRRELALRWHLETGVRVRDRLIEQALGWTARDDGGSRIATFK